MRLVKLIFLTTIAIILSCCQTVSPENPGTLVMTAMGPIQGTITKDENVFNSNIIKKLKDLNKIIKNKLSLESESTGKLDDIVADVDSVV